MTNHYEPLMGTTVMNADLNVLAPSLVQISWEDGAWRADRRLTSPRVIQSATIMNDIGNEPPKKSSVCRPADPSLEIFKCECKCVNCSDRQSYHVCKNGVSSGIHGSMLHDPSQSLGCNRWLLAGPAEPLSASPLKTPPIEDRR
jgi:hypothetical protein